MGGEIDGYYRRLWAGQRKSLATTYSPTLVGSTIGAEGLNFRVRDGNGCATFAIVTRQKLLFLQPPLKEGKNYYLTILRI